ncbi:M20 family metallopeptidase [Arthrobacter sp. H5]|uniref:M20 family metallopeptidase n=1 Tax=Arthrobacter sp. H5 TaxID=1267973 RepID=UPI0004893F22|nr:M20 family metallopeptidase [Arthrobacter sp. H5]
MKLTDTERTVLDLITVDDVVGLASALIAEGSENPGGTEAATVAVLRAACETHGFETVEDEAAPGRPNLVATLPGGNGPGIMFLGHSDVVPAGDGWSRGPFAPQVEDGRLYGRGSTDMKGGLAAVVMAMAALRRAGVTLSGPVQLVCTVDEEDLGLGIRKYTAAGPDRRFAACVVAEPTDLTTVIGCRGDSYLELTVTGRAAHSGRPGDGRNAIDATARILDLIRADQVRLSAEGDDLLGPGTWSVGRISGGEGTSIVAAECRTWIDRRLLPGEDPSGIAEDLLASADLGDGISASLDVTMEMPGFRTPSDHALVTTAVTAVHDVGRPSSVSGWTAACDGGFIARDHGIPTIVLGPGGLNDQAHQANESVEVAELVAAAKAYALIVLRLLAA